VLGAGGGLVVFSHFLAWLLKKYHNQTIALLTGFIAGSLKLLWPWQDTVTKLFGNKLKVIERNLFFPEMNSEFYLAILFVVLGIGSIVATEMLAGKKQEA